MDTVKRVGRRVVIAFIVGYAVGFVAHSIRVGLTNSGDIPSEVAQRDRDASALATAFTSMGVPLLMEAIQYFEAWIQVKHKEGKLKPMALKSKLRR